MSNILSLSDVTDSHRVTIDASIDEAFFSHASEDIARYGWAADRMHEVNGHASNIVSRSEQEDVFEKKGMQR